jgi:hypothetical protein
LPRPLTKPEVLPIGQFAKLWGISRDHATKLVGAGIIPAFRIPSVEKYRSALRILLSEVLQKQDEWRVSPSGQSLFEQCHRGRRNGHDQPLRHLPGLNEEPAKTEHVPQAKECQSCQAMSLAPLALLPQLGVRVWSDD